MDIFNIISVCFDFDWRFCATSDFESLKKEKKNPYGSTPGGAREEIG